MLSFRFATPNNTQTPYYISSDIVLRQVQFDLYFTIRFQAKSAYYWGWLVKDWYCN
jgi:hypothetical protein